MLVTGKRDDHQPVRQTPGWATIPIAFSNGDGTWNITNGGRPDFIPSWANQPGVPSSPPASSTNTDVPVPNPWLIAACQLTG